MLCAFFSYWILPICSFEAYAMTLQQQKHEWIAGSSKSSFVDRTNNKKWIMAFPSTQTKIQASHGAFLVFFLLLVHFYIVSISRWKFNVDIVAHNRTECDGFVFIFYSFCVWFHLMCSLFSQLSHCSMWVVRRLTGVRHSAVFFQILYDIVCPDDESMRLAVFVIESHKHMLALSFIY